MNTIINPMGLCGPCLRGDHGNCSGALGDGCYCPVCRTDIKDRTEMYIRQSRAFIDAHKEKKKDDETTGAT